MEWYLLLSVFCWWDAGDRQSGTGTADGYVQYYVNTEGTKLLQDTFTTEATDDTGLVTAMADALENQKEGTYLEPLLPDGVQILSYSLKEEHLTLNLSEDYRTADDAQKVLLRAGLVRSFVQFEGVKDVTFEINGQTLADSSGNAVGPLTEEDFVEAEGREIDAYQYGTFTLYFADASGKKLVAETQNVYYSSSEPKEREVVELLLKGPLHTELKATLSPDVKILNATGGCVSDFWAVSLFCYRLIVRENVFTVNLQDGKILLRYVQKKSRPEGGPSVFCYSSVKCTWLKMWS